MITGNSASTVSLGSIIMSTNWNLTIFFSLKRHFPPTCFHLSCATITRWLVLIFPARFFLCVTIPKSTLNSNSRYRTIALSWVNSSVFSTYLVGTVYHKRQNHDNHYLLNQTKTFLKAICSYSQSCFFQKYMESLVRKSILLHHCACHVLSNCKCETSFYLFWDLENWHVTIYSFYYAKLFND